MAQVKIYGRKANIKTNQQQLSKAIHATLVDILALPKSKRFHRFIALEKGAMIFPDDKSENYTIIEIMMIKGRSVTTRKKVIMTLFENIQNEVGIKKSDVEICIIESEPANWGFRGKCGDEIVLDYSINV